MKDHCRNPKNNVQNHAIFLKIFGDYKTSEDPQSSSQRSFKILEQFSQEK